MKMCKIFNGEYIEFTKEKHSNLCINPFSIVVDIRQDMQMLLPMLEKMAKPKMGCDDYELSVLREAIAAAYKKYERKTTVARVADILMEKRDKRRNNLGLALQNYGPGGEYGRWFEGESTLKNADVPLQILELEELNSDKHLRAIVLMYILYQTTQMMYFGDRNRKKLVIIDEAWDLFSGNEGAGAAKFIETSYRRARKYNGSMISITQSIKDYYMNDSHGGHARQRRVLVHPPSEGRGNHPGGCRQQADPVQFHGGIHQKRPHRHGRNTPRCL